LLAPLEDSLTALGFLARRGIPSPRWDSLAPLEDSLTALGFPRPVEDSLTALGFPRPVENSLTVLGFPRPVEDSLTVLGFPHPAAGLPRHRWEFSHPPLSRKRVGRRNSPRNRSTKDSYPIVLQWIFSALG
jgi:hypothetical protein